MRNAYYAQPQDKQLKYTIYVWVSVLQLAFALLWMVFIVSQPRRQPLTLKRLILFLAFFAAAITLMNSFYASYQVQRSQLIQHALDSNFAYATKLAATTDNFLQSAQQQLAYSASHVSQQINSPQALSREADRLRLQTDSFNSVVIADATGRVLATSPDTLDILGQTLTSAGALEALREKQALISKPYISAANNLLIFISHPLYDREGHYIGYVGGSLYLKKRSILNDLLGQHYYQDGSYLYVVDQNKRIIYHPKPERVGDIVTNNPVINRVLQGQAGSDDVLNSEETEMLAGYAPVEGAGWGIVAQRPLSATLVSLDDLMSEVLYRSLPLGIATFIAIWLLARFISWPLQQLADTAKTMDHPQTPSKLNSVRSWYFESAELKQAMLKGVGLLQTQIGQLRHAASTDPLTGVYNRRRLDILLEQFAQKHIPYAVLAVDIDHFKQVNDVYGHSAGDEALVCLTQKMSQLSREQDIIARTGGEEFVLVLPHTTPEDAGRIAERLREQVAQMPIKRIGHIQISVGIACLNHISETPKQVLKHADLALYEAKNQGRNRCIHYRNATSEEQEGGSPVTNPTTKKAALTGQ